MLLKIAVFLLIFAILFIIREALIFGIALFSNPEKYKPSTTKLILIGVALSYIFTIIFTGLTL
jgi:ABC-type Fe3+-siderophore transport system permease subunit